MLGQHPVTCSLCSIWFCLFVEVLMEQLGAPVQVPASLLSSSGGKPKDLRPLLDGEDPAQLQITNQPWSITADRSGSRV